MDEVHIDDITDFVKRFRTAVFPEQFERLKNNFIKARQQARQTTPRFNIFYFLGIAYQEKTHSTFLANLLNPYEKHEHDFLFLESFLKYCQKNLPIASANHPVAFPALPEKIDSYKWQIKKENVTEEHGRLDIVIQCKDLGFLCVIENKVLANESTRQLHYYWQWMQTHKSQYPKQALLFLTPNGRKANSAEDAPCFRLSYSENIYQWLLEALKKVESPRITAVIEQYLQLINNLKELP